MKTVALRSEVAGRQLAWLLRRGSDRGILFLHGLGCSKESFLGAFEPGAFGDDWTLMAPDLLGHGASSQIPADPYSLEAHSDAVVSLVSAENLRELHVVGHSMGGAIGLICTDRLPNIAGFFSLEGNLVAEDCSVARKVASVTESRFVDRLYPMAPLRFRCQGLEAEPPPHPLAFYRSAKSLLEWSEGGALLTKLKQLRAKKLYVYGERNKGMPVLAKLDGIDVAQIPDSGHFMMLERPRETYATIAARL